MLNFIAEHHIIEILIFIWAIAVGVLFWRTIVICNELHDDLAPRDRKANPSELKKRPETREERRAHEDMVVAKRDKMNLLYSLFANFTSVFPLWGMLGTVISLIALAGKMAEESLAVDRFFTALYTTLLGIVFAIAFKAADAVVSVKVAGNNKEADTLLERNSAHKKQEVRQEVKAS
jgi:biopolymer transport protein ExbB/TolQ